MRSRTSRKEAGTARTRADGGTNSLSGCAGRTRRSMVESGGGSDCAATAEGIRPCRGVAPRSVRTGRTHRHSGDGGRADTAIAEEARRQVNPDPETGSRRILRVNGRLLLGLGEQWQSSFTYQTVEPIDDVYSPTGPIPGVHPSLLEAASARTGRAGHGLVLPCDATFCSWNGRQIGGIGADRQGAGCGPLDPCGDPGRGDSGVGRRRRAAVVTRSLRKQRVVEFDSGNDSRCRFSARRGNPDVWTSGRSRHAPISQPAPRRWIEHSSRLDDAALHHRQESRPILQDADVAQHVAVDDQHVGQLAGLQRAELVAAAHDLGAGLRGAA